jgi:hypothetical protein
VLQGTERLDPEVFRVSVHAPILARGALDVQVALANADDLNRVLDILGYRIRYERARGMRLRIV